MAGAIIATVDREPAPLRVVPGSLALRSTIEVLRTRLAGFEAQEAAAASTDVAPGEVTVPGRQTKRRKS